MIARYFACMIALSTLASSAFAWSSKEHMQLTRMAVHELLDDPATPPAMKQWLHDAQPDLPDMEGEKRFLMVQRIGIIPRNADGLAWWCTMPDMAALMDPPDKKIAPFNVHERLLHFIDLEFFAPDESQRTYTDDLSHKPKPENIPHDMSDPRWIRSGMLPFRVEDCYHRLVDMFRGNRLVDSPGQFPRDEHATKWAGMLAHYAEDNTQPQHATIDYKSSFYFANKRKAPNVHSEVEYKMVDDENADFPELRQEYWAAFLRELSTQKDPVQENDPWKATVLVSLASYDALPLIGHAAAASTKNDEIDTVAFFHFHGPCFGHDITVLQMKAHQTAWAVKRVERLWLQAWNEAHAPTTNP